MVPLMAEQAQHKIYTTNDRNFAKYQNISRLKTVTRSYCQEANRLRKLKPNLHLLDYSMASG